METLHPETRLGYVALTITNLARALSFYEGVLGLTCWEGAKDRFWLGAEPDHPLVQLRVETGAHPRPPGTTGLYHFALLLPARVDLARILQRFHDTQVPLQGAADHWVSEALYLTDPEGNGIEIYADRPRDTWRFVEGELQISTEPLDARSLIAEIQEEGPQEVPLPAGTRIGHIHLQVHDLPQAEMFYREVLGFELVTYYGSSAAFLSAGGYHHHIGLNTWLGKGASPPGRKAAGLSYFTILLPNQEEWIRLLNRLRRADLEIVEEGEAYLVRDPSENHVLIQVDPRGE